MKKTVVVEQIVDGQVKLSATREVLAEALGVLDSDLNVHPEGMKFAGANMWFGIVSRPQPALLAHEVRSRLIENGFSVD